MSFVVVVVVVVFALKFLSSFVDSCTRTTDEGGGGGEEEEEEEEEGGGGGGGGGGLGGGGGEEDKWHYQRQGRWLCGKCSPRKVVQSKSSPTSELRISPQGKDDGVTKMAVFYLTFTFEWVQLCLHSVSDIPYQDDKVRLCPMLA